MRTSPLSLGTEGLSCLGAPAPISLLTRALWRLEPWPAFGESGTSKASVTAAGEGCRGGAGSRGVGPWTVESYPAYMPKDSVTGPGAAGRSLICPGAAGRRDAGHTRERPRGVEEQSTRGGCRGGGRYIGCSVEVLRLGASGS